MAPNPHPNLESELLQLQDIEFRAKALHNLDGDQAPNIFDRLADACKRKIAILEELSCLARIEELKTKLRSEGRFPVSTDRIQ
jgi:hypothetical protein